MGFKPKNRFKLNFLRAFVFFVADFVLFPQPVRLRYWLFLSVFTYSLSAQQTPQSSNSDLVYQQSLDLSGRLNVLMVSLQPGHEDLATLAYYRFGRGAKIMSAYVTNGEGGEGGVTSLLPNELAAKRREEAFTVMQALSGDAYFVAMPDIPAARDTAKVRSLWHPDTLQWRFVKMLFEFKPDLVIVCRDWEAKGESHRWNAMVSDLLEAVKMIEPVKSPTDPYRFAPVPRWPVGRVVVDDGRSQGANAPVETVHQRTRKSYKKIGEEAAALYRSHGQQRLLWSRQSTPSFRVQYPGSQQVTPLERGLPPPLSPPLRSIERQVRALAAKGTGQPVRGLSGAEKRTMVRQLVAVMDSIDLRLALVHQLNAPDRRALLHWKTGLEDLRLSLLDVAVHYRFKDTVVTELQLAYLSIDSVTGVRPGGKTEIFFPGIDQGWIVNENIEKRIPFEPGLQLRLLSPRTIEYNFPLQEFGLLHHTYGKPLMFFVIHRGKTKEESFISRTILNMFYAPRFTTEVLTPLVSAVEGEPVAVRLTNNSRDGVRDTLVVRDSILVSNPVPFRLSEKGSSQTDTLFLAWKGELEPGTYVFPIRIGRERVAQFAARKFDVAVDSSKRVGFIPGVENSPTAQTLRRLGLRFTELLWEPDFEIRRSEFDVLIIDRRALTSRPWLRRKKDALRSFAEQGGHVLILSQDEELWNENPLLEGMRLKRTLALDEEIPLEWAAGHTALSRPNALNEEDWSNWIYERALNNVDTAGVEGASVLLSVREQGLPLILTKRVGAGKMTYVDCSLHHQFLNIHAGAFRLLANLIAY
ncbi:MAG: PIG-L family deacetylase [Bacteroidota bacterium]